LIQRWRVVSPPYFCGRRHVHDVPFKMRLDPSHCPGISKIEALGKGGLSLGVYAVLAVLYAVVGRQMLATVGEPYQTAMNQQVRIEATLMLFDGLETRNIMQLQAGLTKAAELPTFNETLFADGRSLLGGLRQRMEALTAAVEAAEPEALGQALDRSIELHADGRPYVDRYHVRLAAKKLNAIVQAQDAAAATPTAKADAGAAAAAAAGDAAAAAAAPEPGPVEARFLPLFERVKAALQLGRGRLLTLALTLNPTLTLTTEPHPHPHPNPNQR
jgi:hypothetical protein